MIFKNEIFQPIRVHAVPVQLSEPGRSLFLKSALFVQKRLWLTVWLFTNQKAQMVRLHVVGGAGVGEEALSTRLRTHTEITQHRVQTHSDHIFVFFFQIFYIFDQNNIFQIHRHHMKTDRFFDHVNGVKYKFIQLDLGEFNKIK